MMKILGNIYLIILSFLCNRSSFILEFTRNHKLRGKGQIFKYLKTEKEITSECNGIIYSLYLRDDIQQQLYMNVYEWKNVEFITGLLKPGDIFFDAGANVGAYTLPAAKKLTLGENIYSFEPEPDNFKRLDTNCGLNSFSEKVNRFQLALSNKSGNAMLFKSESRHSGWHSLTEFKDISTDKTMVITETVDNFVNNKLIKRIDLMKIDVEANEFELLEGAKNCLRERIIKMIYIEFNGPRLSEKNRTFQEFINLFAEYNYFPQKINIELVNKMCNGEIEYDKVCENFLFETN